MIWVIPNWIAGKILDLILGKEEEIQYQSTTRPASSCGCKCSVQ